MLINTGKNATQPNDKWGKTCQKSRCHPPLYLFKTMAQLANDGYGGTAAVPVPGTRGLSVVSPYSGS